MSHNPGPCDDRKDASRRQPRALPVLLGQRSDASMEDTCRRAVGGRPARRRIHRARRLHRVGCPRQPAHRRAGCRGSARAHPRSDRLARARSRWTSTVTWPASRTVAPGSPNFEYCRASRPANRTISRAVSPPCSSGDSSTASSARCTRSCTTSGLSTPTGCSGTSQPTSSCVTAAPSARTVTPLPNGDQPVTASCRRYGTRSPG